MKRAAENELGRSGPPGPSKRTGHRAKVTTPIFTGSPGSHAFQSGAGFSGVKFTAAGMRKSTAPMPSANIPVVCPLYEPELADFDHMPPGSTGLSAGKKRLARIRPAVMKYNLTAHW